MHVYPLHLQAGPRIFLTSPLGAPRLSPGERQFNGFWWRFVNLPSLECRFAGRVQVIARAIHLTTTNLLFSGPPSGRQTLLTAIEDIISNLNSALLGAGWLLRTPPTHLPTFLVVPPEDQDSFAHFLTEVPPFQRLILLEQGLGELFMHPYYADTARSSHDVQDAFEVISGLADVLHTSTAILRRTIPQRPTPVPLADGQVFGPLTLPLADSEVAYSRYPPLPLPSPSPPPSLPPVMRPCLDHLARYLSRHLHTHIKSRPGSLQSMIDHASIKLLARGICTGAIPLPPFLLEPEESRTPAASSCPSLHVDISVSLPFSNIGGPSRKPSIPAKLTAGARRRALTRRAFAVPSPPKSLPLSIRPHALPSHRRLPVQPTPPCIPPSTPHPAWEPLLRLKLGDVGWDPHRPLPLVPPPRVSAWEGLPELLLKLGDVGWRAFTCPRPPRPDPP